MRIKLLLEIKSRCCVLVRFVFVFFIKPSFKDKTIASKATTELLTHPLILEENEVLKAQAADANELHVIASILEINRD